MRTAWFQCLLAAALFGAATPASKMLVARLDPWLLAGLLYLGAALVTLPWAVRSPWTGTTRANVLRLGGAVLSGGVLAPVLLMNGLKVASSASVSLWLNLEGAATAVLSALLFREHLGARVWTAVVLMFAAGGLVTLGEGPLAGPGVALVVGACLCWGLDNNLTAINDGFTPSQTTCIKGLVAGVVNIGVGLLNTGAQPSPSDAGVALLLGALSYGASLVLYINGAQKLGATRSQLLFSTGPFLGVVLAWTALHEPVQSLQLVAAAALALGVWMVAHAQHAHAHVHPAVEHTHVHRHDDGHHQHTHPGLPPETEHAHVHVHAAVQHNHPHVPDLHHRH